MKRRTALGIIAAGLGASLYPSWLAKSFFLPDHSPELNAEESQRATMLRDALRNAAKLGKPVLVFVIPASGREKWRRGEAFGQVLNYGNDELFATLALCEVVCAGIPEVEAVLGRTEIVDEPYMLLIETGASDPQVRTINVTLSGETPGYRYNDMDWDQYENAAKRYADQNIEVLSEAIDSAVTGSQSVTERRMRESLGHCTRADLEQTEAALSQNAPLRSDLVYPLAGLIYHRAVSLDTDQRDVYLGLLAAEARQRLKVKAPAGSSWARSSGCGVDFEDTEQDERAMIGCGMGHTPEVSRRFLYFFSRRRS